MKTTLALLLCCILGTAQADLTSGLVAHYLLKGNLSDAAGNGRSLTNNGALAPGRFAYHEGLTITNPTRVAGGFVKFARKNKVEIIRKGQPAALVVDVSKIERGQAADLRIEPDDYIGVRGPTQMRPDK